MRLEAVRSKDLAASRATAHMVVALAVAAVVAIPARAQTDAGRPPYREADWALLPEWCIDTQDGPFGSPSYSGGNIGRNKSPRSDQWTGLFGADFWHMHHFCRALYADQRSRRPGIQPAERVASLNRALGEFAYVVQNCRPEMPLMPEVHYRAGDVYLRKGDRPSAGEAFAAARRLKPDYWPAYVRWADELMALKLYDQAAALLTEGLAITPDEPELQRAQKRLEARRTESRR